MMHFTKCATVNIFVYGHLWLKSNRNDATLDFHFRDLEMTLQSDIDFPIVVVVGVCFFLCRSTGDRDSDEFGQLVRSLVGAPGG